MFTQVLDPKLPRAGCAPPFVLLLAGDVQTQFLKIVQQTAKTPPLIQAVFSMGGDSEDFRTFVCNVPANNSTNHLLFRSFLVGGHVVTPVAGGRLLPADGASCAHGGFWIVS